MKGEALSGRERDVLALLAEGKTRREIGAVLFLSEGTVRAYVWHAYRKLGAHNMVQAVKAFERLRCEELRELFC